MSHDGEVVYGAKSDEMHVIPRVYFAGLITRHASLATLSSDVCSTLGI